MEGQNTSDRTFEFTLHLNSAEVSNLRFYANGRLVDLVSLGRRPTLFRVDSMSRPYSGILMSHHRRWPFDGPNQRRLPRRQTKVANSWKVAWLVFKNLSTIVPLVYAARQKRRTREYETYLKHWWVLGLLIPR